VSPILQHLEVLCEISGQNQRFKQVSLPLADLMQMEPQQKTWAGN